MNTAGSISAERLSASFAEIETLVEPDFDGWTRTVFSPSYREERQWILQRFKNTGLENVHTDACGNILGILPGTNARAKPIVLGSHTDTVERGGRFDGVAGVLGALEIAERIQESGNRLDHPLMVVDFFGEEANPFGLTCLGSKAMVGKLSVRDLNRASPAGGNLGEALEHFGLNPSHIIRGGNAKRGSWHSYIELHIEQSTSLEESDSKIGVVTAVAGIKRLIARYIGQYDHAGGARMQTRKEALLAAASSALEIHEFACGHPEYAVATTTHIDSLQSAQNVVPGKAELRAEMRSTDSTWLGSVELNLAERLAARARDYGCEVDLDWFLDNQIVQTNTILQRTIATAAGDLGLPWRSVPSGATHDSVHMSSIAPMGMIFVPSVDGRSHCPEEFTTQNDILNGIYALERTVRRLDKDIHPLETA